MGEQERKYPKSWLILGGIGFGLYYMLGLAYFETFGPLGLDAWLFFLPVWLLLSGTSVALALRLVGRGDVASRQSKVILEWVFVPVLVFGGAGLLLYGYGVWTGHAFSIGQLFINMALVGLLPLQIALILIPQPKSKVSIPQPLSKTPIAENRENSTSETEKMLVVEASQGEPQFKIRMLDLIAVEAADNYCKFHYLRDGQPKVKLLRMTMKEAEEAVHGDAEFYRCHRSFLVNGRMVTEVAGNSQAYRLKLMHLEESIPVSRSFDIELLRRSQ